MHTNMRFRFLVLIVCFASSMRAADPTIDMDDFTVRFPSEFEIVADNDPSDGLMIVASGGDVTCVVGRQDLQIPEYDAGQVDTLLRNVLARVVSGAALENVESLKIANCHVLRADARNAPHSFRVQAAVRGRRAYLVMATSPNTEHLSSRAIDAFFESFRLKTACSDLAPARLPVIDISGGNVPFTVDYPSGYEPIEAKQIGSGVGASKIFVAAGPDSRTSIAVLPVSANDHGTHESLKAVIAERYASSRATIVSGESFERHGRTGWRSEIRWPEATGRVEVIRHGDRVYLCEMVSVDPAVLRRPESERFFNSFQPPQAPEAPAGAQILEVAEFRVVLPNGYSDVTEKVDEAAKTRRWRSQTSDAILMVSITDDFARWPAEDTRSELDSLVRASSAHIVPERKEFFRKGTVDGARLVGKLKDGPYIRNELYLIGKRVFSVMMLAQDRALLERPEFEQYFSSFTVKQ